MEKEGKMVIDIKNIVTRLPELRFTAPVNWRIDEGQQWAVIGPNGAGKTLIADIMQRKFAFKEGEVVFAGDGKVSDFIKSIAFKDIYSLADCRNSYYQQRWHSTEADEMPTVEELLKEYAGSDNLAKILTLFCIEDLLPKRLIFLSSGELRKFLIVRTLLSRPRVLILDNPFIGLDAPSRDLLVEMLGQMTKLNGVQVVLLLSNPNDIPAMITHVLPSFESSSEELKFNFYDGVTNINPLFGFCFTRDALAASQSIVEKFVERNDPRGTRAFMDPDWVQREDPSEVNAAPNGKPEQVQFTYDTSIFYGSSLAPTMMLSYHELLFLKAEALCRLNKKDEAEPILKEAIQVAFNNMNRSIQATINCPDLLNYGGATAKADLTEEVAAEYFDKNVKPLFEANPLKETMIQKYLAFFGASGEAVEAYNDYRRLKAAGEDFITLKNKGKFPLRFIYGSGDATANNNIKEAVGDGQYVYSEPVWWAGGSR